MSSQIFQDETSLKIQCYFSQILIYIHKIVENFLFSYQNFTCITRFPCSLHFITLTGVIVFYSMDFHQLHMKKKIHILFVQKKKIWKQFSTDDLRNAQSYSLKFFPTFSCPIKHSTDSMLDLVPFWESFCKWHLWGFVLSVPEQLEGQIIKNFLQHWIRTVQWKIITIEICHTMCV